MAVCFGEAVNLGHVETERFDGLKRRRGGRRAGGQDLDRTVESAAVTFTGVDDHVQNDGRPPEMGDTLVGDRVVYGLRGYVAAADDRPAKDGNHPAMVPAIAMKERHHGEKTRVQGHPPGNHGSHRHEVGAAVMVNRSLWLACGAGCVVEGETFPFVFGHSPFKAGIPFGDEFLVFGIRAASG